MGASEPPMQHQATPNSRLHAPELRNGMTDAERRLWAGLRAEQLGVKFRRQHPLGLYVIDFACLDPKLAIEVDGSQHFDQLAYDSERDRWLASQGFVVLRFHANETMSNTAGVLSRIQEALAQRLAPTPTLLQRGRESTPRSPA